MLGLKIVCWAYLIFILMGRVVIHDRVDRQSNQVRCIDNVMVLALIFAIYFLSK